MIGALHIIASCAAALVAVVAWFYGENPARDALVRRACGALSLSAIVFGLVAMGPRHRALAQHSLSAAAFFERHAYVGALSLVAGIALAIVRRESETKTKRAIAVSVAVGAAIALSCVAMVHAYAPSAAIE